MTLRGEYIVFLGKALSKVCDPTAPSADVLHKARQSVYDIIGCALAGCNVKSIVSARNELSKSSSLLQATILGTNQKVDIFTASMLNAMAAYTCDFDDMSLTGCGHPSVPVFPVALALSEWINADGLSFLAAYIRGVEISSVIGSGFSGSSLSLCWNPTTICGGFGAVAAAAYLLKLDEKQTTSAFSMFTCEVGGTKANYGTDAKDVSIGFLCRKAILCVLLAKSGICGNPESFEGRNGLLHALAPDYDLSRAEEALHAQTSVFLSPGLIMKPYPCCRSNHNAIDGILHLKQRFQLTSQSIQEIHCHVDLPSYQLDRPDIPRTPEEAKFSTAYCIALALIKGTPDLDDFSDYAEIRSDAVSLCRLITVEPDTTIPNGHFSNRLEILTKKNCTYSYLGLHAKGEEDHPLSPTEQKSKFLVCAKRVLSESDANQLYSLLTTSADFPAPSSFISFISRSAERKIL